jgi:hypothetical protein
MADFKRRKDHFDGLREYWGVFFFRNSKLQDSSSSYFENVHNHKILDSRFFLIGKSF